MNKLDELLKLKELLDLGIITENDFNRKKAELLSDGNTGYDNSDSIKEGEIIIGENEKECPTCKFIIEKESEICKFCDYDFIYKNNTENNDDKIDNNNLKKYISVFFLVVIFIFLGTWFFIANNSEKIEVEPPKVAAPVSEKPTSLIIKDSVTLDSLSKMANAPAAESLQKSEKKDSITENISNFAQNFIQNETTMQTSKVKLTYDENIDGNRPNLSIKFKDGFDLFEFVMPVCEGEYSWCLKNGNMNNIAYLKLDFKSKGALLLSKVKYDKSLENEDDKQNIIAHLELLNGTFNKTR